MSDGVKGAWSLWSSEGCAIRHGSHQPHVATEHQECGQSKLRCATIVKRVPESKGLVLTKKKEGEGNETYAINILLLRIYWGT